MTKILFLDLDGTIREPITGKFIDFPLNQRLIEGADKAIEFYKNQGWILIGITNQGGVEAGYKSLDDCILEQKQTLFEAIQIDSIFFCPDFKGRKCVQVTRDVVFKYSFDDEQYWQPVHNPNNVYSFRKPGTGMLRLAIEKLTQQHENDFINRCWISEDDECWMVGDRKEDKEAADNLGINYLAADIWRSRFLPGIHEFNLSPREIQFLEGIKLS
ncbi:HAD hydrolase-like protein [Tolypothrix sp. PCC 7601]|uniref:HAD hydrolase-like protein n=1 Tax=Tolypothrix sp. PCC 7601 TaxID=1188 RepID=UPI0021E0D624|nr:HAD hydrolase-like protein [Tolypothrix sp. PCC 7601]UYD38967.1 HAD hydrolase-like protein [Tolypothrix sp. PCC 7601]